MVTKKGGNGMGVRKVKKVISERSGGEVVRGASIAEAEDSIRAKALRTGVYKPVFSKADCLDYQDRLLTELSPVDLVLEYLDFMVGDDKSKTISISKHQLESLCMTLMVFRNNMKKTIEEGILIDKDQVVDGARS